MKRSKQERIEAARRRGDLVRYAADSQGYITEADVTAEERSAIQAEQSRRKLENSERNRTKEERLAAERRWHDKALKLYCDGCFNAGIGGIGIISEDGSIQIRLQVTALTSNATECLAAIEALSEAKRRGITNVLLHSDSRLVVEWTNGSFRLKSQTAHQYVPQIRQLLMEVQGKIVWIPGVTNPADKLSREAAGQARDAEALSLLERIIRSPMGGLRFGDFASLRVDSGWDVYSRMRLDVLRRKVDDDLMAQVENKFDDPTQQGKCLRWILRGLTLEKAIRKVLTDLEIGENARKSRSSGNDDWLDER